MQYLIAVILLLVLIVDSLTGLIGRRLRSTSSRNAGTEKKPPVPAEESPL